MRLIQWSRRIIIQFCYYVQKENQIPSPSPTERILINFFSIISKPTYGRKKGLKRQNTKEPIQAFMLA